jgi:hypothetical protein
MKTRERTERVFTLQHLARRAPYPYPRRRPCPLSVRSYGFGVNPENPIKRVLWVTSSMPRAQFAESMRRSWCLRLPSRTRTVCTRFAPRLVMADWRLSLLAVVGALRNRGRALVSSSAATYACLMLRQGLDCCDVTHLSVLRPRILGLLTVSARARPVPSSRRSLIREFEATSSDLQNALSFAPRRKAAPSIETARR